MCRPLTGSRTSGLLCRCSGGVRGRPFRYQMKVGSSVRGQLVMQLSVTRPPSVSVVLGLTSTFTPKTLLIVIILFVFVLFFVMNIFCEGYFNNYLSHLKTVQEHQSKICSIVITIIKYIKTMTCKVDEMQLKCFKFNRQCTEFKIQAHKEAR